MIQKETNILDMKVKKSPKWGLSHSRILAESMTSSHVRGNHVRMLGWKHHRKGSPKYRDVCDISKFENWPGDLLGVTD